MNIEFHFEIRGEEVLVQADYHFTEKSYSNGDRFAEPDDDGFCHVTSCGRFDFFRLTDFERQEIMNKCHEVAHEQHAEQYDPEPYEFEFS